MNVSLTPELEKFVNEKVKSGLYNSASEVIRESLRLLIEKDLIKSMRTEELGQELKISVEKLKQGKLISAKKEESLRFIAEEISKRRLSSEI
jgi:antitoxin ParD1/3/4